VNRVEIRVLVFDLGGVLLDFRGVESLNELSNGRVGVEEFSRFWSDSRWAGALHRGQCSLEEFAEGAVREFSLSCSPKRFLEAFHGWLHGPYRGAFDLLRELRQRYRLACLSNTNAFDVHRLDAEMQLREHFDECFFSNEIGFRKPDPQCYLHVIGQLDVPPAEIAFFDDNPEYVAGASAVGIRAFNCVGFDQLCTTLRNLGLLDDQRAAGITP
jgi:HAD superfamily hydrolase (TIGR01509 family)